MTVDHEAVAKALLGARWVFAKTMPANPHEWTQRKHWTAGVTLVPPEKSGRVGPVKTYIVLAGWFPRTTPCASGVPVTSHAADSSVSATQWRAVSTRRGDKSVPVHEATWPAEGS